MAKAEQKKLSDYHREIARDWRIMKEANKQKMSQNSLRRFFLWFNEVTAEVLEGDYRQFRQEGETFEEFCLRRYRESRNG